MKSKTRRHRFFRSFRSSRTSRSSAAATARLQSLLADRATRLRRDPAALAAALGYSVQPFHQRWLRFQQDNPRTLLLAPRGHGKSSIAGIAFAIWKIIRDPNVRILIVSSTHDQARIFLREIRTHLERNSAFTALFGNVRDNRWSDDEIIVRRTRIAKEATVTAAGASGSIVGRHFDVVIADDIIDEENSWCESQRAKLHTWFHKTLFPCLEPGGEIHVIGTRYHEADLYGHLIRKSNDRRGGCRGGLSESSSESPALEGRDGSSEPSDDRPGRHQSPALREHPDTPGSADSHSSFIVHRSSFPHEGELRSAEAPSANTPPASPRRPAPEPARVPACRKSFLIGVLPPADAPASVSPATGPSSPRESSPAPGTGSSLTPPPNHSATTPPPSSALRTSPSSANDDTAEQTAQPSGSAPHSSFLIPHSSFSSWLVLQDSALPSGQPLWPGKFPLAQLDSIRSEIGEILFACQYLNDPRGGDAGIFKESWIQYYETLPLEPDTRGGYRQPALRIYQGVDLAISQSDAADYFAVVTIAVDKSHNIYVLDAYHGRLTFDKQMHKIRDLAARFHPLRIAIESNAFQDVLPGELVRTSSLPVRKVRQTRDKLTRAIRLSPQFENGKIFLKRSMTELVNELLLFPRARHDDLFDALEMAVNESINTATLEAGLY